MMQEETLSSYALYDTCSHRTDAALEQ